MHNSNTAYLKARHDPAQTRGKKYSFGNAYPCLKTLIISE